MTVQNLPVKSIVHGDKILPTWMIKKVKTKLKDKFIPLYLTSDRHIVNGLSRFYAAVELGYDKVPCVILEEKHEQ